MIYRRPGFLSPRMLRLLAHPFPSPSPVLSLFLSLLGRRRRSSLLTGEEGEGVGEEPNHTTTKKPSPL
jgi:hypothetical protein